MEVVEVEGFQGSEGIKLGEVLSIVNDKIMVRNGVCTCLKLK